MASSDPASVVSAKKKLEELQKKRAQQLSSFPAPQRSYLSPNGPVNPGHTAMVSPMDSIMSTSQRRKVQLQPGHSPLDWESRKQTTNMKGPIDPRDFPLRVTKDELSKHKSKYDFWISLNNKVYNLTPYLDFHPGGVEVLMKCAGKDGTFLFNKYHRWVNYERILDACFIGFMV
ncbi:hypothetical protein OGAPHI_004862 [Ogataea philodendri]|uniref:Cytochrome b5 heme-binding domain-containing protein n=1 Tax=Ogataea philodendri TaxID=1378263 RepID=A0A9P8P1M1_9ASCO|nr:uncharacterized protein OGAPHI_004862 [Ogataea philodendri]KAH3664148.1 hypothetical protein OGAPHI_004862 [Ogataea philodendri]